MLASVVLAQQVQFSVSSEVNTFAKYGKEDRQLLKLHEGLIRAESTSYNEAAAANFLRNFFDSIQWSYTLIPTAGDEKRMNIFAWPGETNTTAKVLMTSHIDTVPPYIGYHYDHSERKIYGRGSADAKASVATQLMSLRRLIENKEIDPEDVAVLYVVGEETSGDGMRSVSAEFERENRTFEHVVFGEPTESKMAVGHKGMVLFNLTVNGRASHSGYPELGVSATEGLVDVLHQLQHHDFPGSKALGNTTLNVGRMEGGIAAVSHAIMSTEYQLTL